MKSASLDASITAGIFGGSSELYPVHLPTSCSASAFQPHKAVSQSALPHGVLPATGNSATSGPQQTVTVTSYRPKLGVVTTRSFSTDTDLDGLGNDQIEALLRSETTEVLEEELDDFFNEDSSSLLRSTSRHQHQQPRTTRISGPGSTGSSTTAALSVTSHSNNLTNTTNAISTGSASIQPNSTTMIITSSGGRTGSNTSLETSV